MTDVLPSPSPGAARCPGPSTRDIIISDAAPAPWPLTEESYAFIDDADVPFANYTSKEYAALEHERLWSRTWQWACREEHLAKPGDYYVYDIGDRSALVVRTKDGSIKAYHNFCRHRGTQLKPSMTYGRSTQLRCPFHGWTWDLQGELIDLPCRWDFPHVTDESARLPEVRCELWGGFVFVNFSDEAPSLLEYLGPLVDHFANWPLEDRYIEAHARKTLPCNWKAACEAFLEAYHVVETHSAALPATGDANAQYDVFSDHVSRFIHTVGYPSPHLANPADDDEMLDILFRRVAAADRPELVPGKGPRDLFAEHLQRTLGEQYDRDFSHLSTSETIDSIEYFLFPNAFFFPGLDKPIVYRFRPNGDDVDSCIFDLLFMRPKPATRKPPKPPVPFVLGVDDSYTLTPNLGPRLAGIYDEDTANMKAQTKGFKGSPKGAQTLGNYQEVRARHLHVTVEKYINGEL